MQSFQFLPSDIRKNFLLSFLDLKTLLNLATTCREYKPLANQFQYWKPYFEKLILANPNLKNLKLEDLESVSNILTCHNLYKLVVLRSASTKITDNVITREKVIIQILSDTLGDMLLSHLHMFCKEFPVQDVVIADYANPNILIYFSLTNLINDENAFATFVIQKQTIIQIYIRSKNRILSIPIRSDVSFDKIYLVFSKHLPLLINNHDIEVEEKIKGILNS